MNSVMTINGLTAKVHMPDAPSGDQVHQLPPSCIANVHSVDDYHCPANWMNGSSQASSYFVPVQAGKHLWLDFNGNVFHKHHVAIVLSVQGINPITGQHIQNLRLEQYRNNCPVHNEPFKSNRLCSSCGYEWPNQNYMTTVSHPHGLFWIDGWRNPDGTVRGFLITEDVVRGVAAQMIGEERVFAIGIAFYLSKDPKPEPVSYRPTRSKLTKMGGSGELSWGSFAPMNNNKYSGSACAGSDGMIGSSAEQPIQTTYNMSCNNPGSVLRTCGLARSMGGGGEEEMRGMSIEDSSYRERIVVDTKKMEIGAGANISQQLSYLDPQNLDFYQDSPAGLIYLNYSDPVSIKEILKNPTSKKAGFLAGMKVGN